MDKKSEEKCCKIVNLHQNLTFFLHWYLKYTKHC